MTVRRLLVLVVSAVLWMALLAGSPASCARRPAGTSESVVEGIRLRLYVPKRAYVLGEPIVVEAGVANVTDAPRRLAEPSAQLSIVRYDIRQVEGSGPMPERTLSNCHFPPSPDYGWEFKAGEERRCGTDLLIECQGVLPTGVYTVSASYDMQLDNSALGCWHGKISTSTVQFSVVAPDESLEEASRVFVRLWGKWVRTREETESLARRLHKLEDKWYGGPFAEYAEYKEAMLCNSLSSGRGTELLRHYLKRHPRVPYYSESATLSIASSLLSARKFDASRLQVSAFPDGCMKSDWLRVVDYEEKNQQH